MASVPLPVNDEGDRLCNLDLEAAMVALLLVDNDVFDHAADIVSARDFGEPLFGRLFDAIGSMVAKGQAANPVSLKGLFLDDPALNELGGARYLYQLTSNTTGFAFGLDGFRQIAELAERRRMREGLTEAVHQCGILNEPASEVVRLADAAVAAKGESGLRQSSAADCLADMLDTLDEPTHGVLCQHIQPLDDLLGPLRPSQLAILAGRPGMGKTAVSLSYCLGAAQAGHGVLFASLEMSRHQLAGRMAADLCFDRDPIPYSAIRDRKLNDFQRQRIREAHSRLQSVPFQIIDTGSLTPTRLAMLARRHDRRFQAKGHKLELIVIDYLQLMRADSGATKPYERISEISMALKAIAKDMDVAVLALAQLSREVETRHDKRPQLSDLRDSGQIEQDADSVLFLLRQEYYLAQAEPDAASDKYAGWKSLMDMHRGRIEFILAKRRDGLAGSAFGIFNGMHQAVR